MVSRFNASMLQRFDALTLRYFYPSRPNKPKIAKKKLKLKIKMMS
jgi:hypothetical protein